jgi:hypothetical protein
VIATISEERGVLMEKPRMSAEEFGSILELLRKSYREILVRLLGEIVANDSNYEKRNWLVLEAMIYAHHLGYETGIGTDPETPGWPVVYIDLPTGQTSWHIPEYQKSWDGHSTSMKIRRIEEYIETSEGRSG